MYILMVFAIMHFCNMLLWCRASPSLPHQIGKNAITGHADIILTNALGNYYSESGFTQYPFLSAYVRFLRFFISMKKYVLFRLGICMSISALPTLSHTGQKFFEDISVEGYESPFLKYCSHRYK